MKLYSDLCCVPQNDEVQNILFEICNVLTESKQYLSKEEYESYIATMKTDWSEYKALINSATADGNNGCYLTTATFSTYKRDYYQANPTTKGAYYDFTLNEENITAFNQ